MSSPPFGIPKIIDQLEDVRSQTNKLTFDEQNRLRSRILSSADRPSRSWSLTSADTPACFVREPGGAIIDPRNRRFVDGNIASQVLVPSGGVIGKFTPAGESFSVQFAKARRMTWASMSITHYVRVRAGAPWIKVGTDSAYRDLIRTFDHRVYEYMAVNSSPTSLEITGDYRVML